METIKSSKIEYLIQNIEIRNPEIKKLFGNVMKTLWESDISLMTDGRVMVSSGNHSTMSLRESTALILPYCFLSREDAAIKLMIRGVIDSQMEMILTDPYANSFRVPTSVSKPEEVEYSPSLEIVERHFSLDSIMAPIQLLWSYWQSSDDDSIFDETVLTALKKIEEVLTIEQSHDELSEYEIESDNPNHMMKLRPVAPTGMIWSAFRPNGNLCELNYHIPSQMSAVMIMNYMVEILRDIYTDQDSAEEIMSVQEEIDKGIQNHGIIEYPDYGNIYAYETDGLGNHILMDEADFPNLLSTPYIGYSMVDDEIYQNTRKFILSKQNSKYVEGKSISGIGTIHQRKDYVSSRSLIMQALTSENPLEMDRLVEEILKCHGGTYLMPDRLDPADISKITSDKSSMANALLLELIFSRLVGLY